MSDAVYGTVRTVIKADGDIRLDETTLNDCEHVPMVSRAFAVEDTSGRSHRIDVEFHFDPPLRGLPA